MPLTWIDSCGYTFWINLGVLIVFISTLIIKLSWNKFHKEAESPTHTVSPITLCNVPKVKQGTFTLNTSNTEVGHGDKEFPC